MVKKPSRRRFEQTMLPHLAAAYNLALWLLRHPQDAEDVVQDAYLKAYNAFDQFAGDNGAAWILKIVRNTCMTLLKQKKNHKVVRLETVASGSESVLPEQMLSGSGGRPETDAIVQSERAAVHKAISQLPVDYREVIILREFEDLGYQQIADITDVPIGTVMSRLSRARKRLGKLLLANESVGIKREL